MISEMRSRLRLALHIALVCASSLALRISVLTSRSSSVSILMVCASCDACGRHGRRGRWCVGRAVRQSHSQASAIKCGNRTVGVAKRVLCKQ